MERRLPGRPVTRVRGTRHRAALAAWIVIAPLVAHAAEPAPAAPAPAASANETAEGDPVPERLLSNSALAERISTIEAAIAIDRARLEDLVSRSPGEAEPPLRDDPQLIEIARRLPGLQAELARLVRRRDARAATGSAGPAPH